jgi:hypothetical protein
MYDSPKLLWILTFVRMTGRPNVAMHHPLR